ncbi:MAG: hypothetical protein ACWGNV_07870 [Bacteroidales bacterium]
MKLNRKQWFGIITLIVLIIAAILVTAEPWKKTSGDLQQIEIEPLPSE